MFEGKLDLVRNREIMSLYLKDDTNLKLIENHSNEEFVYLEIMQY